MKRILHNPAISLTFCFFFPLLVYSQEPEDIGTIVVSAAKYETSLKSVSTTSTVITAEEIKRKGRKDLAEALRDIVSFDIAQTGGPGGLSYPQLRGLPGKFMVVMIDGVRMNDPSDANGGVGTLFSHLTVDDIERIEVIRGPQSPLYGSNAATGVINIITRRGPGAPKMKFSYEGGSLNSQRLASSLGVGKNGFNLSAVQDYTYTEGNVDLERYRNYTSSIKAAYNYKDILNWESIVRYARVEYNFAEVKETFSGPLWTAQLPDPDQQLDIDYMTLGNSLKHKLSENWQHELRVGISWRDRKTLDTYNGLLGWVKSPWDGFTLDWTKFYKKGDQVPVYDDGDGKAYGYKGTNYDFDYRHTLLLNGEKASDIFSAGFEYQFQDYSQWGKYGSLNKNLGIVGTYLHNQALFFDDALSINSGLRYDDHEKAGGSTTGMIGASCDLKNAGLILRANIGNAFRAPAIYELFNPDFGSPDLKSETSTTYEFGLEKYTSNKKFRVSASTWHTSVDDAIVWVMTDPNLFLGHYRNFDKARSEGVEASLELKPHPGWIFTFNYTYTDSRKFEQANKKWSRNVEIPFNKFNVSLAYLYREGSVSLDGYWVDKTRLRWNGIDRMDSYFRLDLNSRLPLGPYTVLSLRLQNILDKNYQEEIGYREAGFSAFGGIELSF